VLSFYKVWQGFIINYKEENFSAKDYGIKVWGYCENIENLLGTH
jgi:hypothetical protein